MSFAGHVLDMIRRSKDNRDLLKLRREKKNNKLKKLYGKTTLSYNSDITAEELDEINKQLKEREILNDRKTFRMKIIYLTFIIIVVALLAILSKLLFF